MKSLLYYIDIGVLPRHLRITCDCGWLLMTRPTLTSIECSNPNCPIHNSHKMADALKILNIKASIAENKALRLMLSLKLSHHMEVFNPELYTRRIESSLAGSFILLEQEKLRLDKRGVFIYEFMDAFCFDTIGTQRSILIFIGYKDPIEFFKAFDGDKENQRQDMAAHISKRLKISRYSDTVISIVNTLYLNRILIEKVSEWFVFKEVYNETIFIAITGEVTQLRRPDNTMFKPRETLARYWSEKYGINIVSTSLSKKHVQYLIMDTDMTSNSKFNKATRHGINVLTSLEMDEMLEEKYSSRNKALEETSKADTEDNEETLTVEDAVIEDEEVKEEKEEVFAWN